MTFLTKEGLHKHVPTLFEKYRLKAGNKIYYKAPEDYFTSNNTYGDDIIHIFVLYIIGFYVCPNTIAICEI